MNYFYKHLRDKLEKGYKATLRKTQDQDKTVREKRPIRKDDRW